MKNKNISIIMPSYNAEKTISESIESVLSQSFANFQLIICDDSSNDLTRKIIENYEKKDNRIILINNKFQKGAAGARNSCLEYTKSRFVCFLDSDDLWEPTKLETQINFMLKNKIAMSHCDYIMFDKNNNRKTIISSNSIGIKDIIKRCNIGCLTVMLDREMIPFKISFPNIPKEDYALWITLMKQGIISYKSSGNLCLYRKQEKSLSSSKIKEVKKQWIVLKKIAGLNFLQRIWCITIYAINGLYKHTV